MPGSKKWLTIDEVARMTSHLTGHPCSPRQVRHLLLTNGLGTDAGRRNHGQTRLYGPLDAALVRLALRLGREGVSPWVSRVVLTYLRNDIIRAWKAGASVALVIHGVKGSIEPVLRRRPAAATAWVPLREIWGGIETEMQRVAEARETVWMWRKVSIHAVPRASA